MCNCQQQVEEAVKAEQIKSKTLLIAYQMSLEAGNIDGVVTDIKHQLATLTPNHQD